MTLPYAQLIQRIARGEESAWDQLVGTMATELFRQDWRVCGDPHLADDAVQETLLQVRDHAGRFTARGADPDRSAHAWLIKLCINAALMQRRVQIRRQRRELPMPSTTIHRFVESPVAEEPAHDEAARALLAQHLAELPRKQREPLILRYHVGLDHQQIASELGCSPGAARVRLHRAIGALRKRLGVSTLALAALGLLEAPLPAQDQVPTATPADIARWQALRHSPRRAAFAPSGPRPLLAGLMAIALGSLLALTGMLQRDPPLIEAARQPASPLREAHPVPGEDPASPHDAAPSASEPASPSDTAPPLGISHRLRGQGDPTQAVLCFTDGRLDLQQGLLVIGQGTAQRVYQGDDITIDPGQETGALTIQAQLKTPDGRLATVNLHWNTRDDRITGLIDEEAAAPVHGLWLCRRPPLPVPAFLRH